MKTEANSPVDLSIMLGTLGGEGFKVGEKTYTVKPMALKHVDEFMKDNLSLGAQIFSLSNAGSRKKLEKWLTGYCYDANGEAMSLQKAMDDDWNVVNLKEFIKKLCDLSG